MIAEILFKPFSFLSEILPVSVRLPKLLIHFVIQQTDLPLLFSDAKILVVYFVLVALYSLTAHFLVKLKLLLRKLIELAQFLYLMLAFDHFVFKFFVFLL